MFEYVVKEVNKVIDGDTIDITIDLGFSLTTKQRIRLIGIDTPESNSKNDMERRLAAEAREFLIDWISKKPSMKIRTTKDDKYGRMLGELYTTNISESVNRQMVHLGYAWSYDGETKKKDFQQLIERRNQVRTAMV